MGSQHFPRRGKLLAKRKKKTYKSMKQDENLQNYTKTLAPVVGKKSNGKSRINSKPVAIIICDTSCQSFYVCH